MAVRQCPQPAAVAAVAAADVAGAELLRRIVEFHIPAVEHTQQAAVRKEPVLLLVETADPEVDTVTAVDIAEVPVLDMVSALGQDTEWLLYQHWDRRLMLEACTRGHFRCMALTLEEHREVDFLCFPCFLFSL